MNPLLSVIIPTRNRPLELSFAVNSAISIQSRTAVEIIVASNGDTLEYDLSKIESSVMQKIKVVRSPERLSLTGNWRYGLNFAKGEWIHFLGDDDIIHLDSRIDIDWLLQNSQCNGIKFKIYHFDWKNGVPNQNNDERLAGTSRIMKKEIDHTKDCKWWLLSPNQFPTGTAHSLIRRRWIYSFGKEHILNSLSPDWYTGSVFALTQNSFTYVDGNWAGIGNHPNSSIALMKNPENAVSKVENALAKVIGNKELRSIYNGIFPTTWLVRIDALSQARKIVSDELSLPLREIVRNSYDTTPRYVYYVYRAQRQAVPVLGFKHEVWLIYFLCKALLRKLHNSI